jgi:glycine/D-amino acid oxidase-like deaminating enzyme
VVIGAGVVGASLASRLVASGAQVTLLDQDQDHPARATSRWSFAWLNSNDKAPRHYHDLNHAGIRAWAELARDLGGAAWYRPVGHVELTTSEAAGADLAARVLRLASWGYRARLITRAEACELEPSLRPPSQGTTVAWFPDEGYVLTGPLIARLLAHAKAHGARVLTGDQGRVVSVDAAAPQVRTAAGVVLEPDQVVCCAGRWTPELAALTSTAPVPLVPWDTPGATAPGLVVRVAPSDPPAPLRLLHTTGIALRPHSDGQVHLEALDAAVDLHTPGPELNHWAAELLRRARRAVRALDNAKVTEHHVCVRPMPQDGHPIIGPLPGAPSVYVAVTHSGVTLAAHLSKLIAADLLTDAPPPALAPYRPDRFNSLSRTTRGSSSPPGLLPGSRTLTENPNPFHIRPGAKGSPVGRGDGKRPPRRCDVRLHPMSHLPGRAGKLMRKLRPIRSIRYPMGHHNFRASLIFQDLSQQQRSV